MALVARTRLGGLAIVIPMQRARRAAALCFVALVLGVIAAADDLTFKASAAGREQAQRAGALRIFRVVHPLSEWEVVDVPGLADRDEWHL